MAAMMPRLPIAVPSTRERRSTHRKHLVASYPAAAYSESRGRAMAAHQLNPLEVGGSIPLPATVLLNMGVPGYYISGSIANA